MPGLHLEGPLVAWSDTALAGRLGDAPDGVPVLVFLGPDSAVGPDPGELDRARRWIGRDAPGLLPLSDVALHGSRLAWLHPRVEALGVVHLVDAADGQRPPLRVVAELVAAVADTLHAVGAAASEHPGPSPEDLGLDARGRVHLTGFCSPWPAAPVYRDPSGAVGTQALAWRLGVLLALLLAGRIPAVSDRSGHEAMIRRILIRSMSRSGPTFSERYRDWLIGLLAWDPDLRPSLSAVGPGLRDVARALGGPDLAAWSADEVPTRIARARERSHAPADAAGSFHTWTTAAEPSEDHAITLAEVSGHRTLPGLPLSALDRDEPTAESTIRTSASGASAPLAEPGTIPVGVGPPVEALSRRPPTLPAGFLDDPGRSPPPPAERSTAVIAQLVLLTLLGGVIACLLLLVLLVLVLR